MPPVDQGGAAGIIEAGDDELDRIDMAPISS